MQRYEYQVIPAPRRGEKAHGVKTNEDRFAFALTNLINRLAGEGWEYIRAETLPCDERSRFGRAKAEYHHVMIFRRPIGGEAAVLPEPAFGARAGGGAAKPEPRLFRADSATKRVSSEDAGGGAGHEPKLGSALETGPTPSVGPATREDDSR